MAFQHIFYNKDTEYGRRLNAALLGIEDSIVRIIQSRDTMTFMIDGDGSNSTQFAEVATRYGFTDSAAAKAAWDELNSYISKVTTDSSVTACNAARVQMLNKLR